jgi:hypothetical protein
VVASQGASELSVLLGRGGGDFAPAVSYMTEQSPTGVLVRDFDGDKRLDVFVGNQGSRSASLLLGRGDGTFAAARHFPSDIGAHEAQAADFNGDGRLDVAINNANSDSFSTFLNNGDGTFQAAKVVKVCNEKSNQGLFAGDLNGDTLPDLAIPCLSNGGLAILTGQGDGTFDASYVAMTDGLWGVGGGDLNRDGKIDLVVTTDTGKQLVVYLNGT